MKETAFPPTGKKAASPIQTEKQRKKENTKLTHTLRKRLGERGVVAAHEGSLCVERFVG